jgi:lantibiotic leader peptide-processing serine protease
MKRSISPRLQALSLSFLALMLLNSSCKKNLLTPEEPAFQHSSSTLKSTNTMQLTNRYFIFPNGNSLSANAIGAITQAGGTLYKNFNSKIGVVVATSNNPSFMANMQNVAGVRKVVQDVKLNFLDGAKNNLHKYASLPPNSTNPNWLYNMQWNLNAIHAEDAWTAGYRGAGARIAVIDNGFELNHPDMIGRFNTSLGMNFVDGETLQFVQNPNFDPNVPESFYFSHGTHVAGIIAANDNTEGVIGVAPQAEIVPIKGLSDAGWGSFTDLIEGVLYAASINADVANMSFIGYIPNSGGAFSNDLHEMINAWQKAINYGTQQGVTYIAAAGNEGINPFMDSSWRAVPASLANVTAVSATGPLMWYANPTTNLDVPGFYTNHGLSYIDVSAPGGNIDFTNFPNTPFFLDMVVSTANDGDYYFAMGTSMAAPHVSGVAALAISKYGHMTPAQLRTKLRQTSNDLGPAGKDEYFGHGRVNAANAVN